MCRLLKAVGVGDGSQGMVRRANFVDRVATNGLQVYRDIGAKIRPALAHRTAEGLSVQLRVGAGG